MDSVSEKKPGESAQGSGNWAEYTRSAILRFLIVTIFSCFVLPGLFCVYLYYHVIYLRNPPTEFMNLCMNLRLSALEGSGASLPTNVLSLLVTAFPLAVLYTCYSKSRNELNFTGLLCLCLSLLGSLANMLGFLVIDPTSTDQLSSINDAPRLNSIKSLVERATYVEVFYLLTFLGLKPK